MISAVESHLGPGRGGYFTAGPTGVPPIHLQHPPVHTVQIPTAQHPQQTGLQNTAMSAAEFAKPHPKARFNGGPVRNGLSSPRTKYPEQNGPVNLAVMPNNSPSPNSPNIPSPSNSVSPKDERIDVGQPSPKDSPLLDTFNNTRLSYPSNQQAAIANYYSVLYRYPNLYPPAHHMAAAAAARSMQRFDPYQPFMTSYTPAQQAPLAPLPVPPTIPISQQNGVKSHGMERSPQPSIGPMPSLIPPLPTTAQQMYKEKASHNNITNNNNINFKEKLSPNSHSSSNNNNNNHNNNNNNNVGFKVPSGKEGSLKHRILTRPYDKDGKQRSPTNGGNGVSLTNRSVNNNNNIMAKNFMKGSLIELANGDVKRVEDLRSEDFRLSAEKSSDLELADSIVVKMAPGGSQSVIITFSYDNNRSKVDIDASIEHPFYVYGKGWASCNPEGTLQLYGLKCEILQVGDVCISLKPRDKSKKSPPSPYMRYEQSINRDMPQNLSRRPQTIPTTATGTAVSSRPAPPLDMPSSHSNIMPSLPYPNHILEIQRNVANFSIPQLLEPHNTTTSIAGQRPLSHENPSLQERFASLIHDSPQHMPISMVHKSITQLSEEDSIASRKRRWSAPDDFGNEDLLEEQRNALLRGKYSH